MIWDRRTSLDLLAGEWASRVGPTAWVGRLVAAEGLAEVLCNVGTDLERQAHATGTATDRQPAAMRLRNSLDDR